VIAEKDYTMMENDDPLLASNLWSNPVGPYNSHELTTSRFPPRYNGQCSASKHFQLSIYVPECIKQLLEFEEH
jgi:hypothetical protein